MKVSAKLDELRTTLWNYFGQQNEIQAGSKPKPDEVIEKPAALVRYEMSKSLGIPYLSGGLMDQPYMWVQEHAVINNFLAEWKVVQVNMAKQLQGVQNAT